MFKTKALRRAKDSKRSKGLERAKNEGRQASKQILHVKRTFFVLFVALRLKAAIF
jgi:hypothetical protein